MPRFTQGMVVPPVVAPLMAPNAWGLLRAELAQLEYSQAWIDEVISPTLNARSKEEIISLIRTAMNTPEAAAVRKGRGVVFSSAQMVSLTAVSKVKGK